MEKHNKVARPIRLEHPDATNTAGDTGNRSKNGIIYAILSFSTVLMILVFNLYSGSAAAGLPLSVMNSSSPTIAPMLDKTMPGVVNISTVTHMRVQNNPLYNDPFFRFFFDAPSTPRQRQAQSLGSGVIIDADKGFIVTNNHVIDKADEIKITLRDGRVLDAKVIGKDPEVDLAVLQVKADNLTEVPLADSTKLRVGDFVVAIGNPFGLGQTVTSGIVSALGRSDLGIEGYEDFIQTDASINPGNSGGALVNFNGELVGINTAIIGPSGGNVGIGFAIPSNMARDIAEQLISYGEVRRGQLGVIIQDMTQELANAFNIKFDAGVIVSQVIAGSPAKKAGIKQGDIITEINGKRINKSSQLRNIIGLQRVGKKVAITFNRSGKTRTVNAVIEEPKTVKVSAGKISSKLNGAVLTNIESSHPLAGQVEGVEVLDVSIGSYAWRAGLREGDIIVSVNRRKVTNMEEFSKIVVPDSRLLLNVIRGNSALFIVVQ